MTISGSVNTVGGDFDVSPTDIRLRDIGDNIVFNTFTSYTNPGNPYMLIVPMPSSPFGVRVSNLYVNLTTSPQYSDNVVSCVTTGDIVLMTGHILGFAPLPSNEQIIASDVNIDGFIDIRDIIATRRVVLGYDSEFNNSLTVDGTTHNNLFTVYPTTDDVNQINATNGIYSCVYSINESQSNPVFFIIGRDFTVIRLGDTSQNCSNY